MSRLGTKLSEETKKKCGHIGNSNCNAKKFIFISPTKQQYIVIGEFKKFINENNLSIDSFKKYLNKGVIPAPINPNYKRLTNKRINSTGWEVYLADHIK